MKKLLSVLLVLMMLMGIMPISANASDDGITVYLSISRYGEFVTDKNGEMVAYVPVNLKGKDSYTIDDVFSEAHTLYYPEGNEGYATSVSEQWGLGVDKLWGDTSYNFGYEVNGGQVSVMGPGHEVEDGDGIDAYIYRNLYPNNEKYARFEEKVEETYPEKSISLTLSVRGYADGNTIFSPCEGATILINGEETQYVTDAEGRAEFIFTETGTYLISAKKNKTLDEATVPEITAPVCMVNVVPDPAIEIIHNIAGVYAESDFEGAGGNLPWILADMAVYEELYPESSNCLTNEKKSKALEVLVNFASSATKPGDIAKSVLAIRALGYDARKLYTRDFKKIDLVKKLIELVDCGNESVTNIYTLPYVIIALSQAEGYATWEQMQSLITAALESKSFWQDTSEGTDALTPMLLALAPYRDTVSDVASVLDDTLLILQAEQREDGLIDGFEGYESASTGLAICAFSATGINSAEVICGEKSLIDGLMSVANHDLNGFPNAFATEQGFRGLLAWRLLSENTEKIMYDFSGASLEEANVSGATACPVIFNTVPASAKVTIEGKEAIKENVFDLAEREYFYQVTASGYYSKEGTMTVSAEETSSREAKTITVTLDRRPTSSGGSVGIIRPEEDKQEEQEILPETEDLITIAPETIFADVSPENWYYPAVSYVYNKNLIKGTGAGFEPDLPMTRGMLVTVLFRYTAPEQANFENTFSDVPVDSWYAESVNWAASNQIVSGISGKLFDPEGDITREQLALILYRYAALYGYEMDTNADLALYGDSDDISAYAVDAMCYAVSTGIIQGNSDGMLSPKETATRAEVATMLMRFMESAINEE